MPRRTKCTPELIEQVCQSLSLHNSIRTTCDLVGITEETFYEWQREPKCRRKPYSEFSERVKRAQAQSKVILVNAIAQDPAWQAKAWILERQHPKEYAKQKNVQNLGADGMRADPAQGGEVNVVLEMTGGDDDRPWEEASKPADEQKTEGRPVKPPPKTPPRPPRK